VRPFLANVLRGRRVPPERVEAVAHHYDLFGGVSPITRLTLRQAAGLRAGLAARGVSLPIYVGMRNWHPYLADTLADMARAGVRRAIGFIAAAHRSYSGCTQYKENVSEARAGLTRQGLPDVEVTYVSDWHAHPAFVAANAENALTALRRLPEEVRDEARLVFTAHSIPLSMASRYPYRAQFEETARLVAREVRLKLGTTRAQALDADRAGDYATVYQSRSGRPDDPWLEPDIGDYLRAERQRGLRAAVICPVGFVCDHIEVLYDLDVEAAEICRTIGLPMQRAEAVNDHPRFLDMMTDVVLQTWRQYESARPLALVAPA
jgi:ferrochelatase